MNRIQFLPRQELTKKKHAPNQRRLIKMELEQGRNFTARKTKKLYQEFQLESEFGVSTRSEMQFFFIKIKKLFTKF